MNQRMDLTNDTITKVDEILWSKKYACPIYKVGDKYYVGLTGEYGGYFDEINPPHIKKEDPDKQDKD